MDGPSTTPASCLRSKTRKGPVIPITLTKTVRHDLTKVPRFEVGTRGFLFGSLNPSVLPLKEHLGEAAKIIDMIADQAPEGIEVLNGSSLYIYFDGNWELFDGERR